MKSILLLLTIQSSFILNEAQGDKKTIRCDAGAFAERESAKVTCHFNVNIKTYRKNFNIVQYPVKDSKTSSSDSGNYVLVCNWGAGDSLECKTEDGYLFDKNQVSDEVTLEIPNVSLSKAGVYVCQTVPDGGIPLETCNLSVTEKCAAATTEKPCEECPKVKCENSSMLIILLTVCLTTLVLIVIMMCSGLYFRLNYRIERRKCGDSASCGLTVQKVTRRQGNLNATRMELTPLNNVNTESEVDLGDGKNSTAQLPSTGGAANTAAVSTSTQQTGADVNPSAAPDSASGHAANVKDPSLKEEESDKWTADQVCQWLKQEGLGMHVKSFEHKVVGQRLLSFSYETGLYWRLGMGGGHDGKDRERLFGKIIGLKTQVTARQEREKKEHEKKEKERKDQEKKNRKK